VTYLLVAMLVVMIAPLLTASWRVSLLGLGAQGLLLAALAAQRGWHPGAGSAVLLIDLLVLRTWFAPRHLIAIMRRQAPVARTDVIPANLLSWTLAAAAVLLAFRFAAALVPGGGVGATEVAVACAGLLLGLLVLATQVSTFGQVIGVLRVEYAIALFELGAHHEPELPVQLGMTTVLLLTVLTFGAFLRRMAVAAPPPGPAEAEGGSR
jgi:hydrogenase-4 component E